MHTQLKFLSLALALVAPALAEDAVFTSGITGSAHPMVTAPPKGPNNDAVQVAGPLTISVTNSFGGYDGSSRPFLL